MKQIQMTEALHDYCMQVSLHEHPTLKALREETEKNPISQMMSPPDHVQFMQLLIRAINAKTVIEVGTFTGYATLGFALALPPEGEVHTLDISEEWPQVGKPFWEEAQQDKKIILHTGDATKTLSTMISNGFSNAVDFIFIDADKANYPHYYEQALSLLSPQGLIAIDNVLRSGKIVDSTVTDRQTEAIRSLNNIIQQDERVHSSLVPIADGLFLVQRKNH